MCRQINSQSLSRRRSVCKLRNFIILLTLLFVLPVTINAQIVLRSPPNASLSAQTTNASNQNQQILKIHQSVTCEIAGGETHSFKIEIAKNQFFKVVVDQLGIDVVLTLLAPDDKTLAESDSPIGASGAETLMFVASSEGAYTLQIRSLDKTAKSGKYTAQIVELRQSSETDAKRVAAAQIVQNAFAIQEKRTAESFSRAIGMYKEALATYQTLGDKPEEGLVRGRLGQLYIFVGEFKIALDQNLQALAIRRATGDRAAEAGILDNLGRNYFELEDFAKALDLYAQALKLRTGLGALAGTTVSLNGVSAVYTKIGDYAKAIEYANRLLALYRELGNQYGEAVTLNNLGINNAAFGEHAKAIEFYNQALPFFRRTKIGFFEIGTLINLGRSYSALGEQQKAIDYYNQALSLTRAVGNRQFEASTLNNLGSLSAELGDKHAALAYFNQALPIARKLDKPTVIATTLNNIGEMQKDLGEPQKALENYHEALILARKGSDRASEAAILNDIGTILGSQGKFAEAVGNLNQALGIRRALGNPAAEALTLTSLGIVQAKSGELQQAAQNYEQALILARSSKDARAEAETLYHSARLLREQHKLPEAERNVETAISIIESRRRTIVNQELRQSYLAENQDYYKLRIAVLMDLNRLQPKQNFAALAFESAENARARRFLELLAQSRADIREGVDATLLEREKRLRQLLAAKTDYQTRLFAIKHAAEQETATAAEIKKLSEDYEQTQVEIRQTSPRYATLTQPRTVFVKELQSQILDRDTVLLEYALGEEKSYLWAVEQNSLKSYELPKRTEIEAAARRVYEILTARNQNLNNESETQKRAGTEKSESLFADAAARLSEMILRPASAQLKNKRLLIVADGALQYVPFAALSILASKTKDLRPKSENRFLIESNEIVVLPSASTLAVLRDERKVISTGNSIAVVADPVFAADDVRVLESAKTLNKSTIATTQTITTASNKTVSNEPAEVERSARESGLNGFLRLRFSRDEADGIAAMTARQNLTEAVDFAANKHTVTAPDFGKHRIIHLATHALINSQNPQLSGVVLSLFDENGQAQDGFLRLFEIYNLKLDSDLVVLSACQTALGSDVKGEGLIGLTRGFMYAGAPRVVASLWSIDDRATAELMKKFYRKMLGENLRPAAALRAAQIEMLKNPRFEPPYYWAAFTLQGEWR